jgi:hypothetical protein
MSRERLAYGPEIPVEKLGEEDVASCVREVAKLRNVIVLYIVPLEGLSAATGRFGLEISGQTVAHWP